MDTSPTMSAYPDEQAAIDENLKDEVMVWKEIRQLLDSRGYNLELSLVNGLPDMKLVKR